MLGDDVAPSACAALDARAVKVRQAQRAGYKHACEGENGR